MIPQNEMDVPLSENELVCSKCNQAMAPGEVMVSYMGFSLPVEMVRCPTCGRAHVSEALAIGRMLETEQMLEDK